MMIEGDAYVHYLASEQDLRHHALLILLLSVLITTEEAERNDASNHHASNQPQPSSLVVWEGSLYVVDMHEQGRAARAETSKRQ